MRDPAYKTLAIALWSPLTTASIHGTVSPPLGKCILGWYPHNFLICSPPHLLYRKDVNRLLGAGGTMAGSTRMSQFAKQDPWTRDLTTMSWLQRLGTQALR